MGSRSRRHWLASVGLEGETPQQPQQQQQQPQPTRKKKDSRDFYASLDGKPFCTYDREKGTGVARDARGRWCCEYKIQRDGDRVVAIHAGDVVIKMQ